MFRNIAYFLIFGKPLIMYLGLLTLLSFLCTAYIGYSNFKGNSIIPLKWHFRIAACSFTLAFIHGGLGILSYF